MAHERLLSPFAIGSKTVRNRIVATAHGEQWAAGGLLSDHHLDFYERRAEGGAGLLIVFGSAPVTPSASTANTVSLWNESNEPRLGELARRVHGHGAVLMAQASHRGPRERPGEIDAVLQAPSPPSGADKLAYGGVPHVLTVEDIQAIVADFGQAAARLERCGFDGIEITALGTHLIEQFWSPAMNTRSDQYGGSFENRLRFAIEVLHAVRRATGPDFLLAFRISADPQTDLLGLTPEDMLAIAQRLDGEKAIDFFDVSGGSGANTETHAGVVPTDTYPVALYSNLAKRMRDILSVPVLMAGRVLDPDTGERVLREGVCDLVGMTRAQIADPDVARKTTEGRVAEIRPCIAINEGCRRVTLGRSLACSVNPAVAETGLDRITNGGDGRSLSVVGAGPGGMETARVAALRGFDVTVLERSDRVGGQMLAYARMMGAPHLLDHIGWLERELERLGVAVRLETDADEVATGRNDPIVWATGAETLLPPEAAGLPMPTLTDIEALDGVPTGTRRIAVYDAEGRQRGAMIAAHLAEITGATVEFVFPNDAPCEHLEPPNRPAIFRRLAAGGVTMRPHHFIHRSADGRTRFRDAWSDEAREPEADCVIFAGYRRARASPENATRVGDCRAPRLMRNAISEGTKAALRM